MQGRPDRPRDHVLDTSHADPAFELATYLFSQRVPPSLRLRATSALSLLTGSRPAPGTRVAFRLDEARLTLRVEAPDPAWFGSRPTVKALVDRLEVDAGAVTATLDLHPVHFEEEGSIARLVEADVLGREELDELVRAARAGVDLSASPLAATLGRLLSASPAPVPSES